jgi:hypothetical protein
MIQKTTYLITIIAVLSFLGISSLALAANTDVETLPPGQLLNLSSNTAGYVTSDDPQGYFGSTAGIIVRAFIAIIGVVFISYFIHGSFMWMTAAGNEEKITKAKTIIRNAIIGLIVTLAAAVIYIFIRNFFIGSLGTGSQIITSS